MSAKKDRERSEDRRRVRKAKQKCTGRQFPSADAARKDGSGCYLCKHCRLWHRTEATHDAIGLARRHGWK